MSFVEGCNPPARRAFGGKVEEHRWYFGFGPGATLVPTHTVQFEHSCQGRLIFRFGGRKSDRLRAGRAPCSVITVKARILELQCPAHFP